MEEKAYKTMNSTGIISIVMGIVVIVFGIGAGIVSIVNGARLLKNKKGIIF